MSNRTRRNAKVTPHSKFAELRKLRESGKTRLSTYEVEQEEDLYDEVDDEAYKKVYRDRLNQDDFVVDDGGEGYVDNGMDDWGDDGRVFSSEEELEGPVKGKLGKRKREEEKARKDKQEGDIHKYFSKATAPVAPKAKPAATAEDLDFMDNLLGEFDSNVPSKSATTTRRRRDVSPPHKARRLSPIRKEKKPIKQEFKRNTSTNGNDLDIPSSPPMRDYDENMDTLPTIDTPMSDAIPSSPTPKPAVKNLPTPKEESEDEDEFAVAEIKGVKGVREQRVNISGSRPPPKAPLPTPASSSPVTAPAKAPEIDTSSWTSVAGGLGGTSSPASDRGTIGKLSPQHALEEDGSLKFFWTDYSEVNGVLLLFGKVKDKNSGEFVSAFLKIDGLMRNVFFLPREYKVVRGRETQEEVEMMNVHEEIMGILPKYNIKNFKCKSSSRKYAFELPGIPRESDYMKVLYSYDKPPLSSELTGETFSHVFGTNTALFEQFVLCRGIKGPCWLNIENPDFTGVQGASWCKFELQVAKPQYVSPLGDSDNTEAPPLKLMSIALRTTMNVKENKQEIIAITARIFENVSLANPVGAEEMKSQVFSVVRPAAGTVFPPGFEKIKERYNGSTIRLEKSESMLLNVFLAKLQVIDPDVLVGHNLENVDYGILLHRMKEKKTHNWSRIGRLKRAQWPSGSGKFGGSFFAERQLVSGRLMCDLANDLGKSLMTKCQSWSLTEMCDIILGMKRQDFANEEALKTWASNGKGYLDYVIHNELDTHFIASIALKIQMLPLTKQLTNLAGNSWARTLSGTRAERNEYILLHEFYKNKYLCPDKQHGKGKQFKEQDEQDPDEEGAGGKKKDKFKGGLVFEPERGLYDKYILVMDFNSLYPSIIQEFNICFTTVERNDADEENVPAVPENREKLGILPKLISTLVQRRKAVKNLMKGKKATDAQKTQWDIKQQALKLTANSMYGCLGYTRSRFYARPLAMLTTFKGREILQSTKDLAESMMLQVIYGDTDSVMINTQADNFLAAQAIGNDFKKKVNDRYKLLEIDIDNVFQRLLLHAKKKYAAMNCIFINGKLDTKMEVKGLDMRRREFCQLSKEASSHILNEIFTGDEKEVVVERIHEYLRELAVRVREGNENVRKYIIHTKLGKNPEEYPNGKTMPQVQVALRKKAKGEPVKSGDVISYIITAPPALPDGSSSTTATSDSTHAASRAYSSEDCQKPELNLKPDAEWYLVKQLFPPIERLCGPIDGTDASRIAECLGLDTRKYQITNTTNAEDRELHPLESTIPDEERFKDATKLTLRCRACKESTPFEGILSSRAMLTPDGIRCACQALIKVPTIIAQVDAQLRKAVDRYYEAWLICDDASCGNRTRQMSLYGRRCLGPQPLKARGCRGVMRYEYSEKVLYNQIRYFEGLWDVEKGKEKLKWTPGSSAGAGRELGGEEKEVLRALGKEEREELGVRVEMNRERFEVVRKAVGRYLEKCGRQWVDVNSLFAFAKLKG